MKWVIYVPREFGKTYLNGWILKISAEKGMPIYPERLLKYLYHYEISLAEKYSKLCKMLIKANSFNFNRIYMHTIFKNY